eukprot:851499-Prorocentrum_minimum.AAC.1
MSARTHDRRVPLPGPRHVASLTPDDSPTLCLARVATGAVAYSVLRALRNSTDCVKITTFPFISCPAGTAKMGS